MDTEILAVLATNGHGILAEHLKNAYSDQEYWWNKWLEDDNNDNRYDIWLKKSAVYLALNKLAIDICESLGWEVE